MVSAAGQHAPLVVHLSNRALAAHGGALGSGHEAFHMSADSGFFLLFAANVQEAVDFTYIARHAAEQALIPGLVVMDGEQTALAVQDVRLLSPKQIYGFIGSPDEEITVPTAAQKLLFGETRRRVPRWHDLDQPVLNGALFGTESFALGALAKRLYFDEHLKESLAESFEQFARRTGRHYGPISCHKLDDAKIVLLAQGAAVETARAVADHVRDKHKIRIGVLGVHCLRPFPGAAIVRCLQGKKSVIVLERLAAPLSDDPPLLREVRAGLDRALEN
ncbi:MAG: pyruvate ferredoxin oxidoreductase, partial [Gammaproteobacteria bacterium]|nr:pyruvate ferredoxin oxidoreductase [Gammaproteobacteria bacterium]